MTSVFTYIHFIQICNGKAVMWVYYDRSEFITEPKHGVQNKLSKKCRHGL